MDPLLIEIPQMIETSRLILRAPLPGDAAEVNQAIVESIADLQTWLAWAAQTPTLEQTEQHARRSVANFLLRQNLSFRIFRKDSNCLIGNVGLQHIDWKLRRFEIGYWLRSSQSSHGFMTEAVNGLTSFAFASLQAVRVEIKTDDKNEKSWRVAERAGFQLEGIIRNDERTADGLLRDTRIYSKIKRDAPDPPPAS